MKKKKDSRKTQGEYNFHNLGSYRLHRANPINDWLDDIYGIFYGLKRKALISIQQTLQNKLLGLTKFMLIIEVYFTNYLNFSMRKPSG